jgi:uncharacterized protein YkwD
MRRLAGFVVLALALVGSAAAQSPSPQPSQMATAQSISTEAVLEQQVLVRLNQIRVEHGLVPLHVNLNLQAVARDHSISMAKNGYFRHASRNGAAFWRRIRPVYPPLPGRSWGAGENIVWQSPDLSADEAMQLWMNSPEHRQNILTPTWREIGIGAVHALAAPGVYQGLDVTVITTDFGVR